MERHILSMHKRRTRSHIVADLSVHHVMGFILEEGHTAQRIDSDYGYDLMLFTYDAQGFVEPYQALLQLKAADSLKASGKDYVFDVDIRDYNLWLQEKQPVILILFDATLRKAFWLHFQAYFAEDTRKKPKDAAATVRVRVPKSQVLNRRAIDRIRLIKRESGSPVKGES